MTRTRWTSMAAIALGTSLAGCGLHGKPRVERRRTDASAAPAAAMASSAETAAKEPEGADVVAPGIVEPWGGQVDLSAQEPGWIAQLLVKEGDVVHAGQLLATLEDGAQRHSVELARAELAEAATRAAFARAAAARISRLHANGTVPDNEADRAASDALGQTAAAEGAQARLRLAQADLERRRITAPSSGTILLSRFHPGEFYSVGAGPLFVLGDMTRLQVRLEVDEIDAHDVQGGASCALYSDGGLRLAEGTIVRLAPKMGRRALPLESPTARADVRIREAFVEIPATAPVVPGQRVWGHTPRSNVRTRT
ncbi:MAG TPA: efflux RND transporter periplasmic adaptor subunit [Gemmatimonadales bacterium]|nr:efflux RND transporter periplasmic adaptor subunit [Gemmatimonadales bacterium]